MAPDIHTLTGAYALDALPDAERAQFEEHLEDCDACAQEVRELQATAADLGHLLYEPPPPALRERVLAEIDETRQEAPILAVSDEVLPLRPRRAPPRSAWMLSSAAAVVAVVVAAGLALQVVGLESRLADMEAVASAPPSAPADSTADTTTDPPLQAPGTTLGPLLRAEDLTMVSVGADETSVRVVMSPTLGEAVFLASGMEPAPHEHAYVLWLVHVDGQMTPAGLFDVDTDGEVSHHLSADMSTVTALGVTVEPESGSMQPTTDPLMTVELSS